MLNRALTLISLLSFIAGVTGAISASSPAASPTTDIPELEVLSRFEVPESDDRIVGVQWASRRSVYLGSFRDGISEVKLGEGLPKIAELLSRRDSRLTGIVRFAVTDDWVVAEHAGIAWTRRSSGERISPGGVQKIRTGALDIAVDGDRIVIFGIPNIEHWERAKGAVLWEGDLSRGLDTWEVLYESEEVEKEPGSYAGSGVAYACLTFLDDGELLVAPNAPAVLPTVMLLSSSGKLKREWTAEDLWGDDEGSETGSWTGGKVTPESFPKYLATTRTVDAVLTLPEGPAIVVREPEGKGVRWRLGVLTPEVRWYEIPVRGLSSVAQLRGDVDDEGRIALVGAAREIYPEARIESSVLLIARIPLSTPEEE